MDIFKFHNPKGDTYFEQGEFINDITDVMWIERYRDPGEFTIKGPLDSPLREQLPQGCMISHLDTAEVMIVENHEISSERGKSTEVTITGRSFETFMENRIITPNVASPTGYYVPYTINAATTWSQAVYLLLYHLGNGSYTNSDRVDNILGYTTITGTGVSEARTFQRQTLYETFIQILEVDNLGVKFIRPGPASPFGPKNTNAVILVHKGVDRSQEITFSYDAGEIDTADYLWSIKSLKTAIVITGRWVEVILHGTQTGYDKRTLYVDGSFIDNMYETQPTGTTFTNLKASFTTFGNMILAGQKQLAIANAKISRNVKHYMYRRDFDVGDIVMVAGEYDESRPMRVIEYVEIEDKNGENSYPTLSAI